MCIHAATVQTCIRIVFGIELEKVQDIADEYNYDHCTVDLIPDSSST